MHMTTPPPRAARAPLLRAVLALALLAVPRAQLISTLAGGAEPTDLVGAALALSDTTAGLCVDGGAAGALLLWRSTCVRRVDVRSRSVATVYGNCAVNGVSQPADGSIAAAPSSYNLVITSVAGNGTGFFIAENSWRRLYYVAFAGQPSAGVMRIIAGNTTSIPSALLVDPTPTASGLPTLMSLAMAPGGAALYVLCQFSIRVFSPSAGTMTLLAGSGVAPTTDASGNGAAWLLAPIAPAFGAVEPASGRLFFYETLTKRVRVLETSNSSVMHVAGVYNGQATSLVASDGGVAATTPLVQLSALAFNSATGQLVLTQTFGNIATLRTIAPPAPGAPLGAPSLTRFASGALVSNVGVTGSPTAANILEAVPASSFGVPTLYAVAYDAFLNATYFVEGNGRLGVTYGNATAATILMTAAPLRAAGRARHDAICEHTKDVRVIPRPPVVADKETSVACCSDGRWCIEVRCINVCTEIDINQTEAAEAAALRGGELTRRRK